MLLFRKGAAEPGATFELRLAPDGKGTVPFPPHVVKPGEGGFKFTMPVKPQPPQPPQPPAKPGTKGSERKSEAKPGTKSDAKPEVKKGGETKKQDTEERLKALESKFDQLLKELRGGKATK